MNLDGAGTRVSPESAGENRRQSGSAHARGCAPPDRAVGGSGDRLVQDSLLLATFIKVLWSLSSSFVFTSAGVLLEYPVHGRARSCIPGRPRS